MVQVPNDEVEQWDLTHDITGKLVDSSLNVSFAEEVSETKKDPAVVRVISKE